MSRILGLLACIAGLVATEANAELWARIGGTENDAPSIAIVDTKTLVAADGRRLAWNYYVSSDANGVLKKVLAFRYEYDCTRREQSQRNWAEYSPTSLQILDSGTAQAAFEAPIPGTLSHNVLEFVCNYDLSGGKPVSAGKFGLMKGDSVRDMVDASQEYFANWAAERARASHP